MIEKFKLNKQKTFRKTLYKCIDFYPKECVMAIFHTLKVKGDYLKLNKDNLIEIYLDYLLKDNSDNYVNFYNKEMKEIQNIIEGDLNGKYFKRN